MRSMETLVYLISNDSQEVKKLTSFFLSQGIGIITFGSAAEYIAKARHDRTACLILDLNLADVNGLDIQSRLANHGEPPVIFVTAHGDITSGIRAMKNGAIDFITEPLDYGQLMAAVELAFAQDQKNRDTQVERVSLLARWHSLTPREAEVLRYTVAGFLNKQAAAELGIAENTFQVHRGRVMRKMRAGSLAELVRMYTKLEAILQEYGKQGPEPRPPRYLPPEEEFPATSIQNHTLPIQSLANGEKGRTRSLRHY